MIVCDQLSTHGAGAQASPRITLAGCWAHVLRRFEEAQKDHPEAAVAIEAIGKPYEIDARASSLQERAELRQRESAAVLEELHAWLNGQPVIKTLKIGEAIAYTLAYWSRLTHFVNDPRIPLDNNATELGVRSPLYSLVETAKLNGLEPAQYLINAVRAAKRGEVLLPLKD